MIELLVVSGLPGTGKSTLAAALGKRLRAAIFSVDPIESALLRAGIARSFETGLAAYLVVEALADAELGLGRAAIVDAVSAEEPAKDMWRALASKHGVVLRVLECVCSSEALHRERLTQRRRGLELPEPTWDDVERRRIASVPWTEPLLTIDSVRPLETNVDEAVAWLGTSP